MKPRIPRSTAAGAERRVDLTVEEAIATTSNMLRTFLVARLRTRGWYDATVDGVRTLYVLKGEADAATLAEHDRRTKQARKAAVAKWAASVGVA